MPRARARRGRGRGRVRRAVATGGRDRRHRVEQGILGGASSSAGGGSRSTRTCRSRARSRAESRSGRSRRARWPDSCGIERRFAISGWVALPLRTPAGVRGALHLSFRHDRGAERAGAARGCRPSSRSARRRSSAAGCSTRSRLCAGARTASSSMTAALSNAADPRGRREGRRRRDRRCAGGVRDRARDRRRGAPARANSSRGSATRTRASSPGSRCRSTSRHPGTARSSAGCPRSTSPLDDVRAAIPGVTEVMELAEHDVVPLRPARRRPPGERAARPVLGGAATGCPPRSGGSSRPSPARRLRRSTARARSSPSRRSRRRFSAAFSPRRCRASKACSSPPATCRAPRARRRRRLVRRDSAARTDSSGSWSGDVVGKGVQAAATMAQLRNALRAFSLDRMKPSSTMTRLNRLAEEVMETAFATVSTSVVDADAGVCRYHVRGPPAAARRVPRRPRRAPGGRARVAARRGTGHEVHAGRRRAAGRHGARPLHRRPGRASRASRSTRGSTICGRPFSTGRASPSSSSSTSSQRLVGERASGATTSRSWRCACSPSRREPLHLRVPSDIGSLDLVRDALRSWLAGARAEPLRRPRRRARRLGGVCELDRARRRTRAGRTWTCELTCTDSRMRIVDRGHRALGPSDGASRTGGSGSGSSTPRCPLSTSTSGEHGHARDAREDARLRKLEAHDRNPRARIPVERRAFMSPRRSR